MFFFKLILFESVGYGTNKQKCNNVIEIISQLNKLCTVSLGSCQKSSSINGQVIKRGGGLRPGYEGKKLSLKTKKKFRWPFSSSSGGYGPKGLGNSLGTFSATSLINVDITNAPILNLLYLKISLVRGF